jgi:four helix bundle protein
MEQSTIRLRSYEQLHVWQRAMELVKVCYRIGALLPSSERFELGSQLRRASVSVPANISEGYARLHRGDYVRHLSFARGSLAEVDTLLMVIGRLGLTHEEELRFARRLADEVSRMLTTMPGTLTREAKP